MMDATREIAWNIPGWYIVVMYSALIVCTFFFFKGLYSKLVFVTGKNGMDAVKGFKEIFPESFNLLSLVKIFAIQGKVTRNLLVGLFHSAIYYGFVVLVIATTLVMIHMDFGFEVFKGWTYIIVSFLADIAGVVILAGICVAIIRRYLLRPDYLEATKPGRELIMYAAIILLILTGYFLEGARILGTGFPVNERIWSPVGYFVAVVMNSITENVSFWRAFHRFFWMFHLAITMVFLGTFSRTKFFHIIAAPVNGLLTPLRRGAVLEPMNFEDENAETFGLGKVSEFTMKNRLDMISCTECGRCTLNCPASLTDKKLDPKKIITKARDLLEKIHAKNETDAELWDENPLYEANELDACTNCGACMEECPVHNEHVKLIQEAKRYKVLTLGEIQPDAANTVNNIKVNSNPWGIGGSDRFKWASGLDIPVAEPGKHVDYLYYVGCAGSFDADGQKVTMALVDLLKKAGVDFAVLGDAELCCGDTVRRFGDEYSFYEIALANIEIFKEYKFDKIIVTCPHGLHTFGKEYKKFDDSWNYDFIHHTELLAQLIREGKLTPNKTVNETIAYHDPCFLGRHHDCYDSPREILKSIPGVTIKELEKSRDRSLCCGMGGGNMWYEVPEGTDMGENRMKHIADSNVPKVNTSCFYCWSSFNDAKGKDPRTESLKVEDVAITLARSVE